MVGDDSTSGEGSPSRALSIPPGGPELTETVEVERARLIVRGFRGDSRARRLARGLDADHRLEIAVAAPSRPGVHRLTRVTRNVKHVPRTAPSPRG